MTLSKLQFKPGVVREMTNYANEGGWYDCDKVRFRYGVPEKIGGWQKEINESFQGVCRLLFNWVSLAGGNYLALGTHKRFYVEYGGAFFDVTPITVDVTQLNAITTGTAGSQIVTFSTGATPHGASEGDFVIVSGASAVDGIPAGDFNIEHTILTTPTTTTFTVQVATGCTVGGVTGGGNVRMQFLYPIGNDTSIFGNGWGAGFWSRGAWGSGSTIPAIDSMRMWSADNFGEDLLFCPRTGPLYFLDISAGLSGNRGVLVSSLPGASDVPDQIGIVQVTDDRHTVAFGATDIASGVFDPLLIRWSDQEDYANWTPGVATTAGELRAFSGSFIVAALPTRQETLVWTDTAVFSFQFTGAPFQFGLQSLAENVTCISPNGAVAVNNVVYWMGKDQFYVYSGRVEPLPCDVQNFVFSNVNTSQSFQIYAGTNESYSEVTWYYCSASSLTVDRYVTYNYQDKIWYYGALDRTTWLHIPSRGSYPYATAGGYGGDPAYLYVHDFGNDDGSTNPPSAITAYITASDIDLGDGERFMFIDKIIPDFTFDESENANPQVNIAVSVRNTPGGNYPNTDDSTITRTVDTPVTQYTPQLWIRLRGRQAQIKIRSDTLGVKWRLGHLRMQLRPDGRR